MGVGTHPCARKRPLGGLRDQNHPGLGGWDKKAVRAIRLRCAPDCFMFMRTQVCYKTYRSTCAARKKLQVLFFLCGGKRRSRRGVRRRPKSRGRRGAYAPRPAPLPRIAPAPEKSFRWHSVRGPPHGWRSRDRRRPRPVSPGSCPEACSPVSSPGGWRWCSPPGILGRRCWPPRLLCRRWASMNAMPPGTRRRKGGR